MFAYQDHLLVTAVLLLGATAATAEAPAAPITPDGRALFASLDANQDGQLTGDEVSADNKGLFDRLVRLADANGDGKLSADEFTAGLAAKTPEATKTPPLPPEPERPDKRPNAGKLFKRLDANGDGLVTLDEVPQERRRSVVVVLKRLKKDNDAGLTKDEFVRAIEGRLERGERPERPDAPKVPPGGPPRGGLFVLFDTDHDGKLSSDEISAASEVLKKLDRDGDGAITPQELMAALPRPGDN